MQLRTLRFGCPVPWCMCNTRVCVIAAQAGRSEVQTPLTGFWNTCASVFCDRFVGHFLSAALVLR